ncbi:MAG TPA: DUF4395 domain-containing protein [Acidimicrobiales bacterium]|jgi:hypothetical protein|nr:DUF4395 domain-containing protein [Acidimicrobiales bacterium]
MRQLSSRLFSFPDPVNEVAARTVAGGVVLLTVATLITRSPWLLAVLAAGFVARVLTGPTLSPLGQVATRVVAPGLDRSGLARPKLVPGPPKRFAQGIGATLSVGAVIAYFAGVPIVAWVLVALITAAAALESVFAFCLGCAIFAKLMAAGIVPESVCEACNNLQLRQPTPAG